MISIIFVLLCYYNIVDTQYDWLIFALLYIGDQIGDMGVKITFKAKEKVEHLLEKWR